MNATIDLRVDGEDQMVLLGEDLALALREGDALLLSGPLGAGKTVLARAILRALADDDALEVPSPTYTLCQTYETSRLAVSHYDFYRLGEADEALELGLGEAVANGAAIIEWPEHAVEHVSGDRVTVSIEPGENGRRKLELGGGDGATKGSSLMRRIKRTLEIRAFLDNEWGAGVKRRFLQGDASSRRYETAALSGETRILMDAPEQPDGPPVADGLPYSRIAHLAENVRPFIAIDGILREAGFAAPEIFARDADTGLLLIEHLGSEAIVREGEPVDRRYLAAAGLLAQMHVRQWPQEIGYDDGSGQPAQHHIPNYDPQCMMMEVSLFADWYVPFRTGRPLGEEARAQFEQIWREIISVARQGEKTLVLRDYHSPNLIWREDRPFPQNLGLIDFQDALAGPCTYDVASLAQDARIDIPEPLERAIVTHYLEARERYGKPAGPDFARDYAIMAAQRATKILGIFVRLNERDGKPVYLNHLPRLRDYLRRSLEHEVLSGYRQWLEENHAL